MTQTGDSRGLEYERGRAEPFFFEACLDSHAWAATLPTTAHSTRPLAVAQTTTTYLALFVTVALHPTHPPMAYMPHDDPHKKRLVRPGWPADVLIGGSTQPCLPLHRPRRQEQRRSLPPLAAHAALQDKELEDGDHQGCEQEQLDIAAVLLQNALACGGPLGRHGRGHAAALFWARHRRHPHLLGRVEQQDVACRLLGVVTGRGSTGGRALLGPLFGRGAGAPGRLRLQGCQGGGGRDVQRDMRGDGIGPDHEANGLHARYLVFLRPESVPSWGHLAGRKHSTGHRPP